LQAENPSGTSDEVLPGIKELQSFESQMPAQQQAVDVSGHCSATKKT
jgi:hypothetical protein